jgi:Uncharacterised protein family (UPF0153).
MSAMHTLPDPTPVFERYEVLVREADAIFARVRDEFSESVTCRQGCSECCHALFDLTLVEAAYLNSAFFDTYRSGPERSAILERAHTADRHVHTIKRKAFKDNQAGKDVDAILKNLAAERVRCPLLGKEDDCLLYDRRPITCRLYGIPAAIGGKGRVCGKSAFSPGGRYPTVNLDRIHERLIACSKDLARHMGSGFAEIHTVLVPVSMALTTEYTAAYYGLDKRRGAGNG